MEEKRRIRKIVNAVFVSCLERIDGGAWSIDKPKMIDLMTDLIYIELYQVKNSEKFIRIKN